MEESRIFLLKKKKRNEECKEKEWAETRMEGYCARVQIFVGAEKQSGIRSARYGTAARSEGR